MLIIKQYNTKINNNNNNNNSNNNNNNSNYNNNFVPLAFQTMGPMCSKALVFLGELGRRLTIATDDPRETMFLFQRISIAIQRFNAVCFAGSFVGQLDYD